jgi:hypothetical protein
VTLLVPAPAATASKTDPATGFTILEQPIAIAAQSPLLDGVPLTAGTPPTVDAATAKATFSYGALLYRIAPVTNAVQIYNGAQWVAEASFDPADPAVAPAELAFDAPTNAWKGIFVLATVGLKIDDPVVDTQAGGRPAFGFLTIFRTPRKPHPTGAPFDRAARSPRGSAFSVISALDAGLVKAGPVHALASVKDLSQADGFAIFVKDGSGAPAADLIVSGDGSLPDLVALHFYQGGAKRAAIAIDKTGAITVSSAGSVTIDAPVVTVTGELRAQHVSYAPYLGGPERYL